MRKQDNGEIVALVLRSRGGDDDAFSSLVSHYTPMLYSSIKRMNLDDIKDEAFSEACIGLFNAARTFNVEQSDVTFGLYARICVTRRLCDFLRSSSRDVCPISDLDVEKIAVSDGIVSKLEAKEERVEFLREAEGLLSQYEYRVFLLWLAGYKTAAIAEHLGVSAKSVDNAKSRITGKLRDGMSHRGS